jgi:dipeptidyl aminopeptidase/acylaminoacyl peptidase
MSCPCRGPKVAAKLALVILVLSTMTCACAQAKFPSRTSADARNRRVTMADVIGMSRFAAVDSRSLSPDGKHLAFIVTKGDLETNTNLYSLFVLRADQISPRPMPELLVSFRSSSNRDAISRLSWLENNETILFLGATLGHTTQLYAIRYRTGKLRRITSHPTNVTSYSSSSGMARIVYAAEKRPSDLAGNGISRYGFHISSLVDLAELIRGKVSDGLSDQCELFLRTEGTNRPQSLKVSGRLIYPGPDLFLSPDGTHMAIRALVRNVDPGWQQYDDRVLKSVLDRKIRQDGMTLVEQYELVDIRTGQSTPLIAAPLGYEGSDLVWSPDSRSVIVTGAHLPLNIEDRKERASRQAHTFVAEVTIANGQIRQISDRKLKRPGWNKRASLLELDSEPNADSLDQGPSRVSYRKEATGWQEVSDVSLTKTQLRPHIFVAESLDRPPRLLAKNPVNRQEVLLFDPNPSLAEFSLGPVEEISWPDGAGGTIKGALYLPPDYVSGARYPLVIQTHGYDPHKFWIDGPYSTAFAAQPLASKGVAVLQVAELGLGHADEGEQNMRAFETAVHYLDQRGIIDRERVGIIGFSRTCYHVKYALTHSKTHFAAASVADGIDAGYFQYMVFANENPNVAAEFELLVAAEPFGKGLSKWLKDSPGFLLDRVETPIEIQSIGPASLLAQWEWFAGLTRLGVPVDHLYIPGGTHVLKKPWDRMASQQTNIDWFLFWLKDEEDADPAKRQQYERWRMLRQSEKSTGVRAARN